MARCVWALVDDEISDHMQASTEQNAKRWIFSMIDDMPHEPLIKMFVTLWAIWSARRKAIHEGVLQSPHVFVNSFIPELATIHDPVWDQAQQPPAAPRRIDERYVWRAPCLGEVKIHVDGGLSRDGTTGASAAVCREYNGNFLGSYAMVFKTVHDPATLEVLACREALDLALDLSVQRGVIACDCKSVVEEIKHGIEGRYSAIIKEIIARSREFISCKFTFEGRILNFDS